ncbi:high-affinity Fe2+/Pb2+ permease [Aequitasia blattaphilus]|uniref:Uncharacterized protein n=1 Tax=Aequitasia blattaphilus TaxID=2949332 RepID=A0ABT1E830_9FIRM|nr:hypothetical protein [Aequitasia blattaphilus]MCP1101978.1 hypothetical protein [Aequitasia blattaphilus]MCR8614618.1 hypothetical protein [Aequitasia blattaphilus]
MRNNGFGIKDKIITVLVLIVALVLAYLIVTYLLPITPLAFLLVKGKMLVFFVIALFLLLIFGFIARKINRR